MNLTVSGTVSCCRGKYSCIYYLALDDNHHTSSNSFYQAIEILNITTVIDTYLKAHSVFQHFLIRRNLDRTIDKVGLELGLELH